MLVKFGQIRYAKQDNSPIVKRQ